MMQLKKTSSIFLVFGLITLITLLFLFISPQPARAQCGSQASSCKNCHEVQAMDPVNNDGTEWHEPHAFGDFCEFCHAGNVQSPDQTEAHTGMVAPLSNVEAACSTCHENYLELAEVYAAQLGVEIGAGSPSTTARTNAASGNSQSEEVAAQTNDCPVDTAIYYDEADLFDYTRQYEESVLGIRDLNSGNLILGIFILLLISGGGLFVALNEGWITISTTSIPDTIDGYEADNVALLPLIEKIDVKGRQALRKLLKKPEKAAKVFKAVADIDE